MRKALAVIYCPRCGTKHEVGVELETLDNGSAGFFDDGNICENCKARYTIYADDGNRFLSVSSKYHGDNLYKFIKEDI